MFVVVLLIVRRTYIRAGRLDDGAKCILGLGLGLFISYNFTLFYENYKEVHANLTDE